MNVHWELSTTSSLPIPSAPVVVAATTVTFWALQSVWHAPLGHSLVLVYLCLKLSLSVRRGLVQIRVVFEIADRCVSPCTADAEGVKLQAWTTTGICRY